MIRRPNHWRGVILIGVSCTLAACASQPVMHAAPVEEEPPSPPQTQVYFYPLQGQSAEQQDRDRYQCYLWAKQQTGFDPSIPFLAPHQRVEVIPQPAPGSDAAAGAVAGAIIGSVIAGPHDSAEGAMAGAMAGAIIGGASDAARQQQTERVQAQMDRQTALRQAQLEQKASDYRRAMSACLEGRGYSVR